MALPRRKPSKLPPQGQTRERYNPEPNAAEKRHEDRMREEPCYGCGCNSECLHHTLLHFDEKRFRRDHRYQLPLCNHCHVSLHGMGCEITWLERAGHTSFDAIAYMIQAWNESVLIERYEGRRYG